MGSEWNKCSTMTSSPNSVCAEPRWRLQFAHSMGRVTCSGHPSHRQVTAPNSSAISSDQPNTPKNNFEHSTEGAHAEPAHAKTSPRHDPNMSTHIGAHNNPNMSTHLDSSIYEEKMKTISLANARLECFVPGSDQIRSDCFEVYPLEGESTGLIVCPNKTELNNWIREVSTAIHRATMKQPTNQPPHAGTITMQGWLYERTPTIRGVEGAWSPRFVAVRDGQIYIFDSPPESPLDWEQCSRVFTLYESLCKSHLKPKQLLDKREHCFSIQHSTKPPVYCSGQSKDEVALWEDRIQKATHEAVYALQTKSYKCRFESRDCMFTIHFNNGFKLMDTITEVLY
uniref:PH domain-containing protein n=1 Tax=Ciona savignyi TaxID=51511 RepID=H2YD53_CIOSA